MEPMYSVKTTKNVINWNTGRIADLKREMLEVNPFDVETKRDIQKDIDRCHRNIKTSMILLAMLEWCQFTKAQPATVTVG